MSPVNPFTVVDLCKNDCAYGLATHLSFLLQRSRPARRFQIVGDFSALEAASNTPKECVVLLPADARSSARAAWLEFARAAGKAHESAPVLPIVVGGKRAAAPEWETLPGYAPHLHTLSPVYVGKDAAYREHGGVFYVEPETRSLLARNFHHFLEASQLSRQKHGETGLCTSGLCKS